VSSALIPGPADLPALVSRDLAANRWIRLDLRRVHNLADASDLRWMHVTDTQDTANLEAVVEHLNGRTACFFVGGWRFPLADSGGE
jgi:hypothetical protein